MEKVCFICDKHYEAGDGTGVQSHFAFQHGLIASTLYNGHNPTGEFVQVTDQGPTHHTWNMRFGDAIQPSEGTDKCVQPGCGAKASRGYYCARHGSA